MSTDMEQLLRTTLAQQGQGVPAETDPWNRFEGRERVHRRNRRITITSLASLVLVAAALIQTGTVPITDGRNSTPSVAPAAPSNLLDSPVRGSLADDQAWQDEFRQSVKSIKTFADQVDGENRQPPLISDPDDATLDVNPDRSRVLYAGDISDKHRLALLAIPFRPQRQAETTGFVWFVGSAGAAPDEMRQDRSGGDQIHGPEATGDVASWPSTRQLDTVPTDVVLVLAAPGAKIETAPRPRYLANGRVDRPWTNVRSSDGSALIRVADPRRKPYVVRVTLADEGFQPMIPLEGLYLDREFSDDVIAAAIADTRGGPVDSQWLQQTLPQLLVDAQLDGQPDVEIRVPWYSRTKNRIDALITLQPRGGGVLAYAAGATVVQSSDGTEFQSSVDMRLLLPAEGLAHRPIAWRPAGLVEPQADRDRVLVVAPPGAASAELVSDGKRIPVELDARGSGTATVSVYETAMARAFDADGKLIGETALPLHEGGDNTSGDLLPGESKYTRVAP